MIQEYTEKEWGEEWDTLLAEPCRHSNLGSCWMACLSCKTVGFFGPRIIQNQMGEITRKYRACKFCGFWQEAFGGVYDERGGTPYRCKMLFCPDCKVYNWKVPWAEGLGHCDNCKKENVKEVAWPSDDPNHPFNVAKNQLAEIHKKS